MLWNGDSLAGQLRQEAQIIGTFTKLLPEHTLRHTRPPADPSDMPAYSSTTLKVKTTQLSCTSHPANAVVAALRHHTHSDARPARPRQMSHHCLRPLPAPEASCSSGQAQCCCYSNLWMHDAATTSCHILRQTSSSHSPSPGPAVSSTTVLLPGRVCHTTSTCSSDRGLSAV